ncbi:uncharacterized protein LOC120338769 isoform X2 [Styela clava]
MSFLKTSSFAENGLNFQQCNRLEEKALQKKLDHMKTMHRQADFNFGLESKGITKRLRDNLERSAQADASIKKIKCSMPNCTTKYHKGRNFAKTLMKVWSDEDAGNTTAMSEEVTIPACINLLRSAGFEIDKSLSRKLDEMRKAQLQIQKMRNARKSRDGQRFNARSKSLPRFNNGRLTSCGNETQWDYINPFESQSTHFPLIQNGEREDLLSSSSSTSSCDILKNGHRRLRSDTQPGKLNRSKRPYSAPDLETKEWQIPEDDKVDGLTGDYYSFRIQKKTGSCTSQGEGRRATSARSYKSRYSTDEFNGVKLCKDTEEEYYEKALKTSTTDLRHKSMTIKPLSTVWGSSEYIECIL